VHRPCLKAPNLVVKPLHVWPFHEFLLRMRTSWLLIRFSLLALLLFLFVSLSTGQPVPEVPKEVAALVGTYSGAWKSFGVDGKGQIVLKSTWTDTMKAAKPVRETQRAWVSTEDVMVFEGRPGAPFTIPGREGYTLKPDGTLGEYFIEAFGKTYRMQKLAPDVWTYVTDASAPELSQMGFPQGATGRHVVIKVITQEAGAETHRISRVTTVNWRDGEDKERWIQFVSLQGFHKREP
jgi:hypothetical protein